MLSPHSIRAGVSVLALTLLPLGAAAQVPPQPPPPPPSDAVSSGFTVFIKGVPVGSEQIGVTRTADGITISSSGRLGAPIDLIARRIQVRYSPDWKPIAMTLEATLRGQPFVMRSTVSGTVVTTSVTGTNGETTQKTDTIEPDTLLLPSPVWGPFEALSARLRTAPQNSTIPAYAVPQAGFPIQVGESSSEKIQTIGRLVEARRTLITLKTPGNELDAEVWGDETGRLLRVTIPAQGVDVVREDIASVAARRVTMARPNDEQVRIQANGFSLAGTVSKPAEGGSRPLPSVLLVGGSGPTDRDETVFGIPIFGQLASALADTGYLVLRYDKRGVGQSGGRAESATLTDFADDVRAAVKYLSERKDADQKRIVVLGHSEGGSVAMLAASKEKKIAALVLVATIGVTGAELNMQQVTHALDRSNKNAEERQSTIDLQKRIQQAVLTGSGWEGVPIQLRRQADVPWFQSFLAFDPAKVMPDVRQPILIVQGELDTQVAPSNAERLEALARARKNAPLVEVTRIPAVNHLLVPATTGEADEYGRLKERRLAPAVPTAITGWLQKTLALVR